MHPDRSRQETGTDWPAFEARLRAYLGGRVDPLWIDDLVGDIMLRLVRHKDTLAAAGSPLAFVSRVAANALTDHYRRMAAEKRALAAYGNETGESTDPRSAERGDAAGDIAQCILPFIRALPETYRDALLLTEIGGLAQAEAARRLGISHSALKSRVRRGRAKLKDKLTRCCVLELDRRGGVADYVPRPPCTGC